MTIRPARGLLLAAMAAALVGAAIQPANAEPAVPSATVGGLRHHPGVINGHAQNLFPEGIAWDAARQRFLVGSLRDGTVSAVRRDGTPTVLVDDPQVLVSTVGLHVDSARGRVLVANSDTGLARRSDPDTAHKLAGIGAYDLQTAERLFYVDLAALAGDGGGHFANDVTFDTDGTAYVTDSFAPIIYRVAVDGSASVFVRDSRLAGPVGGFGLNGIVRQARTLVVGKYDDGTMWRVPIDQPDTLAQIPVYGQADGLVGVDGLLRRSGNVIVGVTNYLTNGAEDTRIELRSEDGWRTARLTAVRPAVDTLPTTVTAGPGGSVYQLSGRIDLYFSGTDHDVFVLRRW